MGEKQFNYRLAFWLIGAVVVCATTVHLVHAYQVTRHAHTLQEQASRAEETGQTEQAAVLLKRYLLFAPNDTAALQRYGAALEKLPAKSGNHWLAAAAYKQVLARSPNDSDLRKHLIDVYLDLGAYSDAREQLEIQLQSTPGEASLEALLGRCLEAEGSYEQALKSYEKAIEHDLAQIDCYSRQAALLYNRFNQPEAADAVMDQLVAVNGNNFAAYLGRCLYRMGRGWLELAAKDLKEAQKLAPDDARVLVTAAELAYQRGHTAEARTAWSEGLKRHPETLNMYLGLAAVELADRRPKEAVTCLRSGLEKYPNNAELLHLLTEAYLAQDDVPAAEGVVAQVRLDSEAVGIADYLHARILLHRGQWDEARILLEKALAPEDLPNRVASRMYLCLAQCYDHTGNRDRSLAAYRKAVVLEPTLMPANLGLATALLAAGKSDEALTQYQQLARLARPPEEVWLLLARTLLQRNMAKPPDKREWVEIEQALGRADQNETLIVPTALLRSDVLLAQGKPDAARLALEQARDRKPQQVELWVALADLIARRGDLAGAEKVLAAARLKLGDRFELRLTALSLGVGLDERNAKTKLLAYEKDLQTFTPDQQRRLLAAVAEVYYRLGLPAEGERLTRELAARPALDLPAAVVVFDLALASGNDALQQQAIAALRKLEGDDGTWWRYGEAQRQLLRFLRGDKTAADEARRLVAELAKRRPDWSRVALLEAALCELNRDAAGALTAYTKAFEQGERQPGLVYRLMQLLVAQGAVTEADDVMSRAQQQVIPHGAFARFAAEIALRVRQYERAAALARLAVSSDSQDPREFIWLGQVLTVAERQPEAEEALRHALALRDTLPEPWVALITFYANTDQVEKADDALRTIADKLPPSKVPLALALCEEALGRLESAERHFLEARTIQPSDGPTQQRLAAFYVRLQQTTKAEAALRDLLDPTLRFAPGSAEENVAWARRQLALLRADDGEEAGYQEALALLKANGDRNLVDQRALLFVQATREKERAGALAALEKTLAVQPLRPEEQFRLAKLYEAENDWSTAREQLVRLLEVDRRNPEYLAYLVAALVRHEQRGEAKSWLEKLEKLEPDSARVKLFRAAMKS